ncbi:hypothetical protein [Streptomyces sp. NBC_01264]|uniref:hypothetical protein n=1 Tax=Streptomyces sp. NBC_01264 TaxID=2903804 RepID=UPI0022583445|nr:hypothetical protein [Streptomyces sp. NBC_01264]MCX4783610.1 hypothetical protein [Streptomyces sp. NBC_01264]
MKSVRFQPDILLPQFSVRALEVTPMDGYTSLEAGSWFFEPAGSGRGAGTVNFATQTIGPDGTTYSTLFAVTQPVCKAGEHLVAELRGVSTITDTVPNGQPAKGDAGSFTASRGSVQ